MPFDTIRSTSSCDVVSLFPLISDLPPGYVVGVDERMLYGQEVVVGIDRVCPMCVHAGPPYSALLKIVGGKKDGLRVCHQCGWRTMVKAKKKKVAVP